MLTDANHPNGASLVTENLTGSHPWMNVEDNVTTGAETHFLLLRLNRLPSRLFENKLSGTVWVADIALVPATGESAKPTK